MSIEKSILQSISGKTVTESRLNDNNVLTLVFKDGGKVALHVNMTKGVDYIAPKTKPVLPRLDRTKRFAEKALGTEPDLSEKPKTKKIKVKVKKKEPTNE